MAKLEYPFTNDTLFKMVFVKYPDLLKRLVAELLSLRSDSITEFTITNSEVPPEEMGEKFCRLDINMIVDGARVDLEIQVEPEKGYPERSLYYWAREYSTAIHKKRKYFELPRTIVVNILAFSLFDCKEFHSEFRALEVTRHTQLTDRLELHYFELPKLPREVRDANELLLWLALFKAETEEDLAELEALEVPIMMEAIEAYRSVSATNEFKAIERMRFYASLNEASALGNAWDEGMERGREEGKAEVIRSALRRNLSVSAIAEFTGLSVDEIKRFAEGNTVE